ncbi:MAG: hypothetical protein RQ826_15715 [Xanthomonadales bacterium]|nr:hypothetical protein [Xanthomonadales bacterium]
MILIGILINAAAPPVSAWLSDAYPESSPTGSVFLSAFTTKTMISQAAADESLVAVYFLLAAASAGVFLHAGLLRIARASQSLLQHAGTVIGAGMSRALQRLGVKARGVFARAWPIGTTALWIAVLLTAYVIFYYMA